MAENQVPPPAPGDQQNVVPRYQPLPRPGNRDVAVYNPLAEGRRVTIRAAAEGVAALHKSAAPMMRPGAITQMLMAAGRRIKMMCPVVVDTLLGEGARTNADIISVVAGLVTPTDQGNRMERQLNVTIQACAVGYSQADCASPDEAVNALIRGIRQVWPSIADNIKNPLRVADNAGVLADPQWVREEGHMPAPGDMAWIIEQLAGLPEQKTITISVFATALVGYCKQGAATQNVLTKVTNAVRDELGLNIILDPNTIRSFWSAVGPWFSHEEARGFFGVWETAIGAHSLRFRLLVQQASWTGMTNFVNIRNAKNRFPDFPWANMAALFPLEFRRYREAAIRVGDDPYYGYRNDLGDAKSTMYPNLAYLCWSLLVEVGGDRSLRDFLGTNRNVQFAPQIDRRVREYSTRVGQAEAAVNQEAQQEAAAFVAMNNAGGVPQGLAPRAPAANNVQPPRNPPGNQGGAPPPAGAGGAGVGGI